MTANLLVLAIHGVVLGMLLFLISAGLTLIYGLMRILNLAQGSFYLFGAYLAISVAKLTGNFLLAIAVAGLAVGLAGLLVERALIRPLYGTPLNQILVTFGFLLILGEVAKFLWGTIPQTLNVPTFLHGSLIFLGATYPYYRLAVIFFGGLVGALLWLLYEKTTFGAILRAIVDDREMAAALAIDVRRFATLAFGLGALLAALGGVLAAPIVGVYPGVDLEVLLLAFAIIVIGGAGSLRGAFVASLLVGLVDTFGRGLLPELSRFTIFGLMAVVLTFRPAGLFRKP